jgi:hypothetical protein
MGSQRNKVPKAEQPDNQERRSEASAVEDNVQVMKRRDRAILKPNVVTHTESHRNDSSSS